MTDSNNKIESNETTQKTSSVKRPLPSGTVTTTRSSIFELNNSNKTKED